MNSNGQYSQRHHGTARCQVPEDYTHHNAAVTNNSNGQYSQCHHGTARCQVPEDYTHHHAAVTNNSTVNTPSVTTALLVVKYQKTTPTTMLPLPTTQRSILPVSPRHCSLSSTRRLHPPQRCRYQQLTWSILLVSPRHCSLSSTGRLHPPPRCRYQQLTQM